MPEIVGASTGATVNTAAVTTSAACIVATPTSGKAIRLLGYRVNVTNNRAITTEDDTSATIACAGTTLAVERFHAPAASATATTIHESGWVNLYPGVKAAASSSALTITLATTLINGILTITTAHVEE